MEEDSPEPTPASSPPEDVEIPEESIYGSNEPLPPAIPTETKHSSRPPDNPSASPSNPPPSNQAPSLKIGLIPFLLLFVLLLGASGTGGFFLAKENPRQLLVPEMDTPKNSDPKNPGASPTQNSRFTPDSGTYRKGNELDARTITKKRVEQARKQVIWITDTPDAIQILPSLSSRKNKDSLPIFVLTGKETSDSRIARAGEYNIPVTKLNIEFERPYSLLIIDQKLIVDISRNNWIWESREPKILENINTWLQDLIQSSTQP